MQTFASRPLSATILFTPLLACILSLSACRGEPGRYAQLNGPWRLEAHGGASAVVQFVPRENRLQIDGREGQMRLLEETADTVRLELTGPDGGRGVTLLRFQEDGSVTMQREGDPAPPPLRLVRIVADG
jgi:hypothetical protein